MTTTISKTILVTLEFLFIIYGSYDKCVTCKRLFFLDSWILPLSNLLSQLPLLTYIFHLVQKNVKETNSSTQLIQWLSHTSLPNQKYYPVKLSHGFFKNQNMASKKCFLLSCKNVNDKMQNRLHKTFSEIPNIAIFRNLL